MNALKYLLFLLLFATVIMAADPAPAPAPESLRVSRSTAEKTGRVDNDAPVDLSKLFDFIKKNKALPRELARIDKGKKLWLRDQARLFRKNGIDPKNSLFSDKSLHLYLVSMWQDGSLSNQEFLTLYTYYLALVQYTPFEDLIEIKKIYLTKAERKVVFFDDNGDNQDESIRASEIIKSWALSTCDDLKKMGFDLGYKELLSYVEGLSGIERSFIGIKFRNLNPPLPNFLYAVQNHVPFLSFDKSISYFLIPSQAVQDFIISRMAGSCPKAVPIFGRINTDTLREIHKENGHPLALYSPLVKNNYTRLHNVSPGPLVIYLHDIFHRVSMARLSLDEFRLVTDYLIPYGQRLLASYAHKERFCRLLNESLVSLNDFDFSLEGSLKVQGIDWYLKSSFPIYKKIDSVLQPRDCEEDVIYYLFTRKLFRNPKKKKREFGIDVKGLSGLGAQGLLFRDALIIKELDEIARSKGPNRIREKLKKMAFGI